MPDRDREIFERALVEAAEGLGIDLEVSQVDTFWRFRDLVVQANRHFNLTRITEPVDFAVKHCADSLSIVKWFRESGAVARTILDVGTGAGVPAVPLCVIVPEVQVTAIDGTGKKARFVAEVGQTLGLKNLTVHHGRAESWQGQSLFDLVVFKAVGPITDCIAWGGRHVAEKGHVVTFRTGDDRKGELADAQRHAALIGLAPPVVWRYELPLRGEIIRRALWVFGRH